MILRNLRRGFSLVELMVAVALFAFMAGGLAAFYGMAFGSQYRRFADVGVANGATLVRRSFDYALGSATYIQDPSTGTAADLLTVWTNLDADGASPLVAGAPVRYTTLCLDASSLTVYSYQGGFPKVDFACGQSPAGVSRDILAGGPGFREARLVFYRPEPNLVQMTCALDITDARGIAHAAQVQAQATTSSHGQN
ncbi:MAG: prepilin-type N-terminal cleavage/methylation domain-containing protein [Elusimicrobia bacterium]|nr:prepilin-type N-terminal cleavage/methylation domain-containing protein [Elusimicrobiota bacterium]